jgi:hypothetical protein
VLGAGLEEAGPAELIGDVMKKAIELLGGLDILVERPGSHESRPPGW